MRRQAASYGIRTIGLFCRRLSWSKLRILYSKGRIAVDSVVVQQRLVAAGNCVLYPLDEQVALRIPTGLNIHDAIIVATALVYRDILHEPIAVITKNGEITRAGLINTVW